MGVADFSLRRSQDAHVDIISSWITNNQRLLGSSRSGELLQSLESVVLQSLTNTPSCSTVCHIGNKSGVYSKHTMYALSRLFPEKAILAILPLVAVVILMSSHCIQICFDSGCPRNLLHAPLLFSNSPFGGMACSHAVQKIESSTQNQKTWVCIE